MTPLSPIRPMTTRLTLAFGACLVLGAHSAAAQDLEDALAEPPEAAPLPVDKPVAEGAPSEVAEAPPPLETPATAEAEPEVLSETSQESVEAPSEGAAMSEGNLEDWIPESFGLDAVLGVDMGMPLDQAVRILRQRGYRPQAAEARRLIDETSGAGSDVPLSATGIPPLGLVITHATIPTPWGIQDVPISARVVMERRIDGMVAQVQLSAEAQFAGPDGPELGTGRVFGVEVYQDYAAATAPVAWFQIEARLRQAAMALPSCELLANRVSLIWNLSPDGAVMAPQEDYQTCSGMAYATMDAAAPDAVIQRLVQAPEGESVAGGSLAIEMNPHPTAGWIWMKRLDAGLAAEVMGTALQAARETPPAALATVEF